jgi:branched-chain amino acid transport system substrate-binding protein
VYTVKEGIIVNLKKAMAVLMVSAATIGLMAGCGGGDKKDAKSSNVVKVGVFLPLTGDNAAGGELELRGIKLANKLYPEINGKKD